MFKKIGGKKSYSEKIVNQIERAILDNKYRPGDKIPSEMEMCDIFDVSRTVVREAIQKLSAKGLIEVKKGSGIFVKKYAEKYVTDTMETYLWLNLNKDYIKYVMQIRKLFEPQLARLASKNRSKENLYNMKKNINELRKCDPQNFKKEGNIDKQFHLQIARSCKNPLIITMVTPIFQIMPRIRSFIYKDNGATKSTAIEYHSKIFEMIKNKDANKAREIMQKHLAIAEQDSRILLETLEFDKITKYED